MKDFSLPLTLAAATLLPIALGALAGLRFWRRRRVILGVERQPRDERLPPDLLQPRRRQRRLAEPRRRGDANQTQHPPVVEPAQQARAFNQSNMGAGYSFAHFGAECSASVSGTFEPVHSPKGANISACSAVARAAPSAQALAESKYAPSAHFRQNMSANGAVRRSAWATSPERAVVLFSPGRSTVGAPAPGDGGATTSRPILPPTANAPFRTNQPTARDGFRRLPPAVEIHHSIHHPVHHTRGEDHSHL